MSVGGKGRYFQQIGHQPGVVTNPASYQLRRKHEVSLSLFALENLMLGVGVDMLSCPLYRFSSRPRYIPIVKEFAG